MIFAIKLYPKHDPDNIGPDISCHFSHFISVQDMNFRKNVTSHRMIDRYFFTVECILLPAYIWKVRNCGCINFLASEVEGCCLPCVHDNNR